MILSVGPTPLQRELQGNPLLCAADTTATTPPLVVVCGHHSGPHTLDLGFPNPPSYQSSTIDHLFDLEPCGPHLDIALNSVPFFSQV